MNGDRVRIDGKGLDRAQTCFDCTYVYFMPGARGANAARWASSSVAFPVMIPLWLSGSAASLLDLTVADWVVGCDEGFVVGTGEEDDLDAEWGACGSEVMSDEDEEEETEEAEEAEEEAAAATGADTVAGTLLVATMAICCSKCGSNSTTAGAASAGLVSAATNCC